MTRTGKIARLPREIREQLDRRLHDGEMGSRLVEWLNSLPETKKNLTADFGGRDINEQNLTEWKQGGHQDWLARQELLACAGDVAAESKELAGVSEGSLSNHLAAVLTARYAALVSGWNGEMDDGFGARPVRCACCVRTLWDCGAATISPSGCGSIWSGLRKRTRDRKGACAGTLS